LGFKKTFITEDKIRLKILDFLSRREHSFKELTDKLKDRVESEENLLEELTKLKEENLQSDERFTESYTRTRSVKGFGPDKISFELKSRGISENLINKIVYSDEINWMEIIRKEFKKKFNIINDLDKEDISRAKKFLLQRGFEFDQINQLFKQ
jgi:regulatory protein